MYKILFSNKATKDLKKVDFQNQKKIKEKLIFISNLDKINSFAKKLNNFELGDYRIRVGNYRIIFDLEKDTIIITAIDHRKDIYK